jgi:hypothetical protein
VTYDSWWLISEFTSQLFYNTQQFETAPVLGAKILSGCNFSLILEQNYWKRNVYNIFGVMRDIGGFRTLSLILVMYLARTMFERDAFENFLVERMYKRQKRKADPIEKIELNDALFCCSNQKSWFKLNNKMKIRRRGMARINEEIDVIKFLRKSFTYNVLMKDLVTERQKNTAMRDGRFIIRGDKRKDEYAV